MKKCTVCGMNVNKLDYGRLTVKAITRINVLGETIKNKNITLDLVLCNKCRAEFVNNILEKRLKSENKEIGCNGDCASCDGARI